VTTGATDAPPAPAVAERTRTVVNSSCSTHGGCRGFTNLVVSKHDGLIVLDPHAVGCRIELDEREATALRDQLTEWLG
jgi:hypothetical protein